MTFRLVRVADGWEATCVACAAFPPPDNKVATFIVVSDNGVGFEALGTWLVGHAEAHERAEKKKAPRPVCTLCNAVAVVQCVTCPAAACAVHRYAILRTLPGHRETSFVEVRP